MVCIFIKQDETQCKARAISGENLCFFHSEKMKEKRMEAVKSGGKSLKSNHGSLEEIDIRNEEDVHKLLVETINDLRQNKISSKSATAIGYLAQQALPLAKEIAEKKIRAEWFKKHPDEKIYMPFL